MYLDVEKAHSSASIAKLFDDVLLGLRQRNRRDLVKLCLADSIASELSLSTRE